MADVKPHRTSAFTNATPNPELYAGLRGPGRRKLETLERIARKDALLAEARDRFSRASPRTEPPTVYTECSPAIS